MFAYLKGTLMAATPSQAVVEVQGIGYLVFIPCSVLGELPQIGEKIQFYTSLVIREFSHALYGFLSSQERDIFEVLLNVTGIGPKLALSLIGHLPLQSLRSAIHHQDLPTLCRVPGVGKKTAERLVIELRDKLPNLMPTDPSEFAIQHVQDPRIQQINDAMLALINLGYNQSTAQKAIKKSLKELPEGVDLAILITTALKNI
jgi:Holliday junction DNA helicase RuvA